VVEGASLESLYMGNCIEGSNPFLSADFQCIAHMNRICYLFLLVSIFGFAQTEGNAVDSLFREDQMYVAVSYNLLQNKPDNTSQYSFSTGFSAGFLRDFPLTQNRHWSIAPGFGYAYSDIKQNINIQAISAPTITTPEVVRSRMQLHYLELPIEVRWRNATPESHKFWRIHTGIKASYLLSGTLNYDSDTQGKKSENLKNRLNDWQYGVYLSFGFNTWNPYIYYGLQPIFEKNKTAVENNSSALHIGLKFYIL
jgi:Outer membrane protein beta-barrel domain